MSEEKNRNKENKPENKTKEILFETTYEKVLFIINKVKDYIKSKSSSENKLIEELDWVIKVIADRSLYTYELIKEKMTKQTEEYNKFINFVKKYNEEILEMNKKHNIVSSILAIRKKEEVLLKPSLILKKMDSINKLGEPKQKKKNNFIYTFGNYILNLYKKSSKNVTRINDDKNSNLNINKNSDVNNNNNNNIEHNENKKEENKNNINEIINDKKNTSNQNIGNQKENKEDNKEVLSYIIPKQKKVYFENNKIPKKEDSDKNINFNINIQRIKITNKKMTLKSKSNTKLVNLNSQEITKKKNNKELMKLTRAEKNNFNQIKNIMRNYYINIAFNDPLMISGQHPVNPNLFKTDFNNIKPNGNTQAIDFFKRYKNTREKTYNLYKTIRQNSNNTTNKSKNTFVKSSKISLNSRKNNEVNEERFDFVNKNTSSDYYKREKIFTQDKFIKDNKKSFIKGHLKLVNKQKENEENNNTNILKNHFEINIKKSERSVPLDLLVTNHCDEVKGITSYDFDIFELKKKIGYNNVLPLMGYTILKTLGLVENKIITTKKLESFLKTVSDNYLMSTLYHNSLHGADVTQSLLVFFIHSNFEEICETTVLDLLGMIVSALGHDLGHPGLNNGYHINASTELGITYNDKSCLENFHSSYLFRILRKEENNILEKFSVQNFKTIRKRMISQILATDMANHGENISLIRAKIKTGKEQERFIFLSGNDKTKFDEQQLLLNYLIHMADLGHNCKKFEISIQWIKLLCEEFWEQGDKEREKGLPISFMCDRNNYDVPSSQIGFLKGFILSSFDCLVEMFPKLHFTIDNAENNIKRWTVFQSQKNLLGWSPEKNKKKENEEEI